MVPSCPLMGLRNTLRRSRFDIMDGSPKKSAMWKQAVWPGAAMLLLAAPSAAQAPDTVRAAAAALGVDAVETLQFTGSGATFTVGQNYTPADPWPRVSVKSYRVSIDFRTGSMRIEMVRQMGPRMPQGGGVPLAGELPQSQVVSGAYAWNEPVGVERSGAPGPATPCTRPEAGSTPWAGTYRERLAASFPGGRARRSRVRRPATAYSCRL
jgi:hypothetical protein